MSPALLRLLFVFLRIQRINNNRDTGKQRHGYINIRTSTSIKRTPTQLHRVRPRTAFLNYFLTPDNRSSVNRSTSSLEDPPAWATELLKQQKQNAEDLQRLKSELEAKSSGGTSTAAFGKGKVVEPEFRFEGNKKQFHLNRSVIEHMDRALVSSDGDEV